MRARGFCTLLLVTVWFNGTTQVDAKLGTAKAEIGRPVKLTLSVVYSADDQSGLPTWPIISDTLAGGIEVMHRTKVDTILADKEYNPFLFRQSMTLTITAWETGFLPIIPFVFLIGSDTLETRALLLEITAPEVDEEADFKDIKGIREVRLGLLEFLILYWPWVASAIVAIGAVLFFVLRKRKVKIAEEPLEIITENTPEEEAETRLQALLIEQGWLTGSFKEHHSEVSEILRGFIERKFAFSALEMTTEEILREMNLRGLAVAEHNELSKVLRLTDLVKYAKAHPLMHEHEEVVHLSLSIVRKSKTGP